MAHSHTRTLAHSHTRSGALIFATVFVGSVSFAQVDPQPRCTYKVTATEIQTSNSGNCGSYTICQGHMQCSSTGGTFRSCGSPQFVNPYCWDYVGGTWNPTTQRCEGGQISGPAYDDTETHIQIYPNFLDCDGGPA